MMFAVPHLFDAVAARFAAEAVTVPMLFGWKEVAKQVDTDARIVWVPGDLSGSLGRIGAPKYPGKDQLLTLFELVTIHITAADKSALTISRLQYNRTRELLESFLRAVHLAAVGTYAVTTLQWKGMHEDVMRRFGASVVLVLEVQSPIVNEPTGYESHLMDAAVLAALELDHAETVRVDREP